VAHTRVVPRGPPSTCGAPQGTLQGYAVCPGALPRGVALRRRLQARRACSRSGRHLAGSRRAVCASRATATGQAGGARQRRRVGREPARPSGAALTTHGQCRSVCPGVWPGHAIGAAWCAASPPWVRWQAAFQRAGAAGAHLVVHAACVLCPRGPGGTGGRAREATAWPVRMAWGLTEALPQATVPGAAGPNHALEPTAPMGAWAASASSVARRLTAGVRLETALQPVALLQGAGGCRSLPVIATSIYKHYNHDLWFMMRAPM